MSESQRPHGDPGGRTAPGSSPGSRGPSPPRREAPSQQDEPRRASPDEGEEQWERGRESRRQRTRQERVLHTRISHQLAEDIRAVAEELRVPVSNLVRNVLEEAFSVVEQVTDDVGDLLEEVIDQAERASDRIRRSQRRRRTRRGRAPREPQTGHSGLAPEFPDVLAWQAVILNAPQRCARTGRELRAGEEAFMGLGAQGLTGPYLSREGLEELG